MAACAATSTAARAPTSRANSYGLCAVNIGAPEPALGASPPLARRFQYRHPRRIRSPARLHRARHPRSSRIEGPALLAAAMLFFVAARAEAQVTIITATADSASAVRIDSTLDLPTVLTRARVVSPSI